MSRTLHFHFLPSSPSHSFTLSTLLAMDSASLVVSSLPTAAKMSRPLPMVEISCPSTVTEADFTLCMTAENGQLLMAAEWPGCLTLHVVKSKRQPGRWVAESGLVRRCRQDKCCRFATRSMFVLVWVRFLRQFGRYNAQVWYAHVKHSIELHQKQVTAVADDSFSSS